MHAPLSNSCISFLKASQGQNELIYISPLYLIFSNNNENIVVSEILYSKILSLCLFVVTKIMLRTTLLVLVVLI